MGRAAFPIRVALLGGTSLLWSGALAAQASESGVDVSVSASASSNPYVTAQDTAWVGVGDAEARPWIRWKTERDSIELRGLAKARAFTERYDVESTFGGSLDVNSRLSPLTMAYGSASVYTTNRRTPFGSLAARPGLSDPVNPLPTDSPITDPVIFLPDEDIALLGQVGRTTTVSAGAGLSHQQSARTSLGFNVGYNRLFVSGSGQGVGYENTNAGVTYTRQVDQRTSIGASASASYSRYEENRPSATSLGFFLNASRQVDRYWSLTASAGISASDAEANGIFPGYSSISPAGSIGICYTPVGERLCLNYSRSQQPSSLGEVRSSDSASLGYSKTLSDRRRIDVTIGYSRSASDGFSQSQFQDIELLSSRTTFSQTISDRLEGYVFGSASRSYGGFLSREPSIEFGVGIRLRLGDRR